MTRSLAPSLLLSLLLACSGGSGDDTAADTAGGGADTATADGGAADGGAADDTAGDTGETAEVHDIDADTLAAWLDERAAGDRDFLLINVHVPYAGDIPGTDTDIAYTDTEGLAAFIGETDRVAVVYCMSGSMSRQASSALAEQGFTGIYDLQGGMNAWEAAGYALEE